MKKYFILGLIAFLTTIVVTADEDAFFSALQSCTPYSNSGSVTTDGIPVKFTNRVVGIEDNKCVYKEYVSYSGMQTSTTCKFSEEQRNELTKVMKAYSTLQSFSGESVDTSSLSKVQDNPVVKVWNKYLQDTSVCNMDIIK